MNEMQLFEVGLSERYSGSYFEKIYVVAENDLDARGKMRRWAMLRAEEAYPDYTEEEWEGSDEKKTCFEEETNFEDYRQYREEYFETVANLFVTRIHHVGEALV